MPPASSNRDGENRISKGLRAIAALCSFLVYELDVTKSLLGFKNSRWFAAQMALIEDIETPIACILKRTPMPLVRVSAAL
ncbi:hypothetical protein DTL21_17080 [Bremerella cremea]|uniref:Uncharacterized protein n=1 Tax=Blastopirellula marina TaxID=124 RepID=A0A2S8FIH2_9BACT|nr:hypothetical protein C5Y83_17065 [Blastopirellula marina]RCS45029.1 hypothetical protein DTL21_17080 [Bremerella cremea]